MGGGLLPFQPFVLLTAFVVGSALKKEGGRGSFAKLGRGEGSLKVGLSQRRVKVTPTLPLFCAVLFPF